MPIYEFFCVNCRTIYNFLSRRVNTAAMPPCPHCSAPLSREVSLFAALRGGDGEVGEGDEAAGEMAPGDLARMEQAMEQMAGKIENLDDSNPTVAAQVMRELASASGLRFNASIEEALSRMESGEDPEAIEAEMGDLLEGENPFEVAAGTRADGGAAKNGGAIKRDPTLYEM